MAVTDEAIARCTNCGSKPRMFFSAGMLRQRTPYCMSCVRERNKRKLLRPGAEAGYGWREQDNSNGRFFPRK